MRSHATDEAYGSDPLLEESGPIRLDTAEGAIPEDEMKGNTECLTCGFEARDCICEREGA